MSTASPEELVFTFLVKALENNKTIQLNIVWGTMALQMAAIGWIISSEQARSYISENNNVRFFGVISVIIIAITHYYMLYDTFRVSSEVVESIRHNHHYIELENVKPDLIAYFKLDGLRLIFRCLFTATLFSFLVMLILRRDNITSNSGGT